MDTKEEVVQYIKSIAEQRLITKEELLEAFEAKSLENEIKTDIVLTKKLGIAEILYYLGGGIVFLGIFILLEQNWSTLNLAVKILTTVGVGLAAYVIGFLMSKNERTEAVGVAFYLISALVTPAGLYVLFDSFGFKVRNDAVQTWISAIMLCWGLASVFFLRKTIFTLFSIVFGTWFYFSLTSLIINENTYLMNEGDFHLYRTLFAGMAYMGLGYVFSKDERAPLRGFLYGFGVVAFLGAALSLSGWKPEQNLFWELTYPILVFGVLFLSVPLKSRAFLTGGTIFLMAYIFKITAEYFSEGFGWPLSLMLAGLAMIGVGYLSLSIKRKYLE